MTFLWLSCDFFMTFSWISQDFLLTFSLLSWDFLINFSLLSYDFLINFSWLSLDFFMTFSWLSWEFILTFSWLYHEFLKTFSWLSRDFSWLSELTMVCAASALVLNHMFDWQEWGIWSWAILWKGYRPGCNCLGLWGHSNNLEKDHENMILFNEKHCL